jgi:hypothetical protein
MPGARGTRHEDSARFIICASAACGRGFFLCRRCDRGNKYCSKACATAARHAYLIGVRRKHASSPEGREDHRERTARYRERRRQTRAVTDLGRQKRVRTGNVALRLAPIATAAIADAGAKANGLRVPPLFHRERRHRRRDSRVAAAARGVLCARCRRTLLRVHLDTHRRN